MRRPRRSRQSVAANAAGIQFVCTPASIMNTCSLQMSRATDPVVQDRQIQETERKRVIMSGTRQWNGPANEASAGEQLYTDYRPGWRPGVPEWNRKRHGPRHMNLPRRSDGGPLVGGGPSCRERVSHA